MSTKNPNTTGTATRTGYRDWFTCTGSADDSFELFSTLDSYEVEELDAHALARFLPSIAPARGPHEALTRK